MNPDASNSYQSKEDIIDLVKNIIHTHQFTIADEDLDRPWGGFFRLENNDAEEFISTYFSDIEFDTFENLSPKFLLVAPDKRLSWQKHARRAELWRVLQGPVGVKLSETDDEPQEIRELQEGELIQFESDVRHRLIGLPSNWGVVTEIWQHTDPDNLSDENDIVRIQDDFGR